MFFIRMRNNFSLLIALCLNFSLLYSQDQKVADSLEVIYGKGILSDTEKLDILRQLSFNEVKDLNLSLHYAEELIKLATKTGDMGSLHSGYFQKGNKKRLFGDLEEALDAYIKSAEIARSVKNLKGEGNAYGAIADIYATSNNHPNARLYYNKAIAILRESNDSVFLASVILNAGDFFLNCQIYDTAYVYFKESGIIFEKLNYLIGKAYCIGNIGMVYAYTGESKLAEKNIKEAIEMLEELGDFYPICVYLVAMADIYSEKGDDNIAVNYTNESLKLATQFGLKEQIRDANLKLSELHDRAGNIAESYNYFKNYILYRDSINNIATVQNLANLRTDFEVSKKQSEVDLLYQQRKTQRWWLIAIATILCSSIILLFMFYRNNKIKQKANRLLTRQKNQIQLTLEKLKSTQAQLIQSEKMASLGELTAGIAHEIQNPLNFVKNFSEVNAELIDEAEQEIESGNYTEIKIILNDIRENEEKIKFHGKKADSIVKGMLLHSRGNSGKKEPTNINALCDEYLRLSFHGFRAKDKSLSAGQAEFNADYQTDFDPTLPKINVVPQDIGRVLLNLINNAFYAVQVQTQVQTQVETQHAASLQKTPQKQPEYKPMVVVSTKNTGTHVEISVKDNGSGIPPEIKEKIFQPFFTTKPTGQGTGLGLSLSYDIVKAHGGEIRLTSKQGEGSEFQIILPVI
jgi:two-component system, NtrC family, sensor kinase